MFTLGVVLAGVAFGAKRLDPRWLLAPTLGFIALVVAHDRVLRRADGRERSVRYYEDGIARLDAGFAGRGRAGSASAIPSICTPTTSISSARAALRAAVPRAHGRGRGDAGVLAARAGAEPQWCARARRRSPSCGRRSTCARRSCSSAKRSRRELHADALERWGESAPPRARSGAARVGSPRWQFCLAALIVATLAGAPLLIPWLAVLGIAAGVAATLRGRVRRTLAATEAPARELALLARLLAVVEGQRFAAPRLVALRQAIATDGVPASREIARLRRLVDFLDARRNQLFAPIGAALLFTTQVALAIDAWRARCGPSLRAGSTLPPSWRRSPRSRPTPTSSRPTSSRSSSKARRASKREALGHPLLAAVALRAQRRAACATRRACCW